MNIGTIVEADMMRLKVGNKFLGSIEEWFIAGLTPGDTFIFAGKKLKFEKVVGNIAFAKVTNLDHQKIPSYNGGNLPFQHICLQQLENYLKLDLNQLKFQKKSKNGLCYKESFQFIRKK